MKIYWCAFYNHNC